jgi:hypothetical protein
MAGTFFYQPEFISEGEERELVERVRELQFSEIKLRGAVARRRVARFGWNYFYDSRVNLFHWRERGAASISSIGRSRRTTPGASAVSFLVRLLRNNFQDSASCEAASTVFGAS